VSSSLVNKDLYMKIYMYNQSIFSPIKRRYYSTIEIRQIHDVISQIFLLGIEANGISGYSTSQ